MNSVHLSHLNEMLDSNDSSLLVNSSLGCDEVSPDNENVATRPKSLSHHNRFSRDHIELIISMCNGLNLDCMAKGSRFLLLFRF